MLKLLIIEDDIIDQLTLTRLIKKNDLECKVTVTMKIQEAKALMEASSFDLVICDLNLPDGKAFDLNQLIRKQPFILLSGYLEPDIIKQAKSSGAIQVLQKSSELTQLSSILNLIKKMEGKENISSSKNVSNKQTFSKFNIQRLMETFNHHIESVAGTIEDFLNEEKNMNDEIQMAEQSGDRERIRFISHKIRSRCVLIGLKEQEIIAQNIEVNSKSADIENLKAELQKLNNSLHSIYPELKEVLIELKNQVN